MAQQKMMIMIMTTMMINFDGFVSKSIANE